MQQGTTPFYLGVQFVQPACDNTIAKCTQANDWSCDMVGYGCPFQALLAVTQLCGIKFSLLT